MFCEIIGIIVSAASPIHQEFAIFNPVTDPVEAHVNGFGTALLDSVVDNTSGTCVVGLDWSGGLRVAEVFEDRS